MRFLQQLDLTGNPCGEEPDYRYHAINKLPSLLILDAHEVTRVRPPPLHPPRPIRPPGCDSQRKIPSKSWEKVTSPKKL
jgi:hypothetical protein